ncbi:MAG: discoidin domain-containing protein, partial [Bryobacteraceae bacterium]
MASNAVDGNTDGNYINGSIMHTLYDWKPWWQVDLGTTSTISSIEVWNRTDCCGDRLSDYWVFVSNTPFLASDTPDTLSVRAGTWNNHQTIQPKPSTIIQAGGAQGRYVRVQIPNWGYLQMAEVKVMGTGGTTTTAPSSGNVALSKPALQSSTFGSNTVAGNAVDGNTDGNYNNGSITHTLYDWKPWWQVDLGATATVSSIEVWNRTDCCGDRLNDYWVFVSNTPFLASDTPETLNIRPGTWNNHQMSQPNPSAIIQAGGAQGRYVRVQLSNWGYLHMAEIKVVGTVGTTTTTPSSGNVALSKPALQSSTFGSTTVAGNAVDGNTDGNYNNGSIMHTVYEWKPWWQVDLGATATVSSIEVWNRTDCCGDR